MKNHSIVLHIDDGSMGGGGPVPHHKNLVDLTHHGVYHDFNDLYDYQYFYFNFIMKREIFHYCLIAHKHGDYVEGKDKYYEMDTGGETYLGYHPNFILFGASDRFEKYSAHVFMHELGHNLLGDKSDATKCGDEYLDNQGHHDDKKCAMHFSGGKAYDYCQRCWCELDLANSLKGSYWVVGIDFPPDYSDLI